MDGRDLDETYTAFCHAMTELGEGKASLFMARFALLAMARELSAERARALICEASAGLAEYDRRAAGPAASVAA